MTRKKIVLLTAAFVCIALAGIAYSISIEWRKASSEDPLVWESDIAAFEENDLEYPAPDKAVVFVGSSSIRLWDSLHEDMAPIPVIQRGFGGAKLGDVVHYTERLVNTYDPIAVVVFAGTNDIHPGALKKPTTLLRRYQEFVARVRADLPDAPIYFIAITPSPMRWEVWDVAQETNELIAAYSALDPTLHVIDTGHALMTDGKPDRQNYIFDGLHLSKRGYAIWTQHIRSRLLQDLPVAE